MREKMVFKLNMVPGVMINTAPHKFHIEIFNIHPLPSGQVIDYNHFVLLREFIGKI